jgi:glycosyltransferase involved in cell wall biosynthesis
MSTKLSICIPTYNRAEYLCETISIFNAQIKNKNIQICVSDNSNNDKTKLLIDELCRAGDSVVYHGNDKNIGIDRNIVKTVGLSDSDYVWIFGDDDAPVDGAVDKILEYISNYPEIDYFIINSIPCAPENMEPIGENITGIFKDQYYDDCEKALLEIGWYTTFVGAFVVKKKVWDSINAEKYLDTVFVHVGKIFEAASKGSKVYFVAQPLIKYRTNNASWSGNYLPIQLGLWPKTIMMLPASYSDKVKNLVIRDIAERFVPWSSLAQCKMAGTLDFGILRKVIFPFAVAEFEFYRLKILFGSLLFLMTPSWFLKILKENRNAARRLGKWFRK